MAAFQTWILERVGDFQRVLCFSIDSSALWLLLLPKQWLYDRLVRLDFQRHPHAKRGSQYHLCFLHADKGVDQTLQQETP